MADRPPEDPRRRRMDPAGKRAAILAAGERVFAAMGYSSASMADIAREADVAVGSIYRHFPDKPALLAALHSAMEDRFIAAMEAGWRSTPDHRARFAPMIAALLDEAEAVLPRMPLYSLTRDLVGAGDYAPGVRTMQTIERFYGEGVAAGAFIAADARAVAAIAYGMVDGAMRGWAADPTPERRRATQDALTGVFERAFVRDPTG